MIYTLDTIPLGRFIDVFLGDTGKAVEGEHTTEEKQKAASRMCEEYLRIVAGKSVMAQMSRRNEKLKIQMRMYCAHACRLLMQAGETGAVRDTLAILGYRITGDVEMMKRELDSIEATDGYRLRKMDDFDSGQKKGEMTRDYFTKERVAVMSHLKMYIDPEKTKAKEYAFFVKMVCDEIDATMKAYKKKR